jgi:putative ABC transport system substrate-binding protein
MKKITIGIILLFIIGLISAFLWMRRQSPAIPLRVYRIGVLARGHGSYEVAIKGFQNQLRELGYVEGQNVTYDVRYLSTTDELDTAAQDFVNARVDLINTYSTPATQAVYRATQKMQNPIPIVFASIADPIAAGVIKNIEQTGTNATGVISLTSELTAKRVELLLRIAPNIKKIAMPRTAKELNDISVDKSVAVRLERNRKKKKIKKIFF